jgi:hypothetical protein
VPAVADDVLVDPSISILACDILDYQTTGPQLSDSYFLRYQISAVTNIGPANSRNYDDKKENQIFLIYKEIQSGAVAKSYMRKGFLIYEEMRNIPIYGEAVSHI